MKRVFGILALLMGGSILAWVGYNLLVERQPEMAGRQPWLALVVSIAMIYVGVLWVRGQRPPV